MLGHHFETKTPATNRTSQCWGTTSRPRHRQQTVHLSARAPLPRHRQQIVHLSAGAPLRDKDTGNRDQDTGNKSYILVRGHHFETKTPSTNRTSQCWGTTSRPRHQQQIVHLCAGAPLRDQDTGNKTYILVLGHHFETKTPSTNRTYCAGAPLRDQDTGNTSYILVLGHHFETKTLATSRTSQCWGTTSRPRHGNKSYIFVLGYHFKTKTPATDRTSSCGGTTCQTPATNRTSQCWGTTSRQRHRKQIIHLNAGASIRDQDTSNKSYILVLGHHFETKTPATDQDTGNKSYIFYWCST